MLPEATVAQGNITNQKAISLWKKKDTNARQILMITISQKKQQAFVNCRSAFAIWTKLAAQYMQNASASTHVLQANFFHYQCVKGHTIMQHITAIKGMAQQLDDLNQSMSQSQIMTTIVSTLPSSYRHFMTVWDNLAEADKTMSHLITKLMNEQHRELNSTEVFNQPRQAEALLGAAKHNDVSKPGKRIQDGGHERSVKRICTGCSFCGRSNHGEDTCTHRINAEAGIIEEQCSYCHNYNHVSSTCRKKIADDAMTLNINESRAALYRPKPDDFAMAADTLSLDPNKWYADSGATHHMCHNRSLMHNYTTIPELSWAINGIGGVTLYSLGQGDIHVVTTIDGTTQTELLNNVLYVPDLGFFPFYRFRHRSRFKV